MTSDEPSDNQPGSRRSVDLGKATAEGATALFFSKFAQQIVGVIGGILLIRLLISPSIYAYISLATTVPGLVMLGNLTGVNTGLTKYLSLYKADRDSNSIWSSFWSAIIVKIATGIILSIVAYFAAGLISSLIGKPLVDPYFKLAAPLPFVWTLQISVKSTMISLGRVRIYSLYQVVDEILISSFPIVAVLLGYGAIGALAAMVLANFVSFGIAMTLSVSTVFSETQRGLRKLNFIPSTKELIKFGLPQGISNSFSTFSGQVVNLIIARFVSLDIYGLYSVAVSASGFANYISDPISSMLLPVYSRIKGMKDRDLMKTAFRETVRYSSLFYFPVDIFLTVFATPFVVVLFGQSYAHAGFYLSIISAFALAYGLGSGAIYTILTSQGYSKFTGAKSILFLIIRMGLAALVIPTLGFVPFLFVGIVTIPASYLIDIIKLKKVLNLRPPLSAVLPMYLATVLTGVVMLPLILIPIIPLVQVVLGASLTLIAYVLFNLFLRSITKRDVEYMRMMLSHQTFLFRVVSPFLSIIERIARSIGN